MGNMCSGRKDGERGRTKKEKVTLTEENKKSAKKDAFDGERIKDLTSNTQQVKKTEEGSDFEDERMKGTVNLSHGNEGISAGQIYAKNFTYATYNLCPGNSSISEAPVNVGGTQTSLLQESNEEGESSHQLLKPLQAKLRQLYKALTMNSLPWMEDVVLSLENHFVELEIIEEESKAGGQSKSSLELDQLFDSMSSVEDKSSRILIEGDPGFGKTTLAAKLCYDFGTEQNYMKDFGLVLFFSLRNFGDNLEEILFRSSGVKEEQRCDFLEMVNSKSVKTLLILDGFDELPPEHIDPILDLIRGDQFPNISVIVTSRPGKFPSNAKMFRKCYPHLSIDVSFDMKQLWSKRVKVIGIREERLEEFIDRHLSNLSSDEKEPIKEKIEEMNNKNILDSDFLRCPLFILMIILLLTDDEDTDNLEHITNSTELYKSVMNFVVGRYLTKYGYSFASPIDLFSRTERPFYIDLVLQLGKFSLKAIKDGKLSFSHEEILGSDSTNGQKFIDLGILTPNISCKGLREVRCYEPVHKTLLEFVAAYFLCNHINERGEKWRQLLIEHRPTDAIAASSLLFPFLTGLMGKEAGVIFDVLRPYAAEYKAEFISFAPTLREVELTDTILFSLNPFLPTTWVNVWTYPDFAFPGFPPRILTHGLESGNIKEIEGYLPSLFQFDGDIKIDKVVLLIYKPSLPKVIFKRMECRDLVCVFSPIIVVQLEKNWDDLLLFISTFQSERISFVLQNNLDTSVFLPLIFEAVASEELREKDIHHIECHFSEKEVSQLNLLIDLIERDRLASLWIELEFLPSDEQLSSLLTSVSRSAHLISFQLNYTKEDSSLKLKLDQLFNDSKKSYEMLRIENAPIECNLDMQLQPNFAIKFLGTQNCNNTSSVLRLLHSGHIASLWVDCAILNDVWIHESLTELDIAIDEKFRQINVSRFNNFPNLQLLVFTMTSFKCQSIPVENWFLESFECLPLLKGIQIDLVEKNLPLAREIVEGITKYLEKRSLSVLPENNAAYSAAPNSGPKESKLQFVRFKIRIELDFFNTFPSYASSVVEFISLLSVLKHFLLNHSLPRLEIIVSTSFLRCMSESKPNGFSSLIEVFPPDEHFDVQFDYFGMKEDDSRNSRMMRSNGFHNLNRFSVSCYKNTNL